MHGKVLSNEMFVHQTDIDMKKTLYSKYKDNEEI